jgi:hypothetical protein
MPTKRAKYQPRVDRVCKRCGANFLIHFSQLKYGYGVFCNKACQFGRSAAERLADLTTKSDDPNGCWEFNGHIAKHGYGVMGVNRRSRLAHVVALESVLGRPLKSDKGEFSLHTCDNRSCVRNDGDEGVYVVNGVVYRRFGHLWLGDNDANMADMDTKGRRAKLFGSANPSRQYPHKLRRGSKSPNAKLTEEDVRDILRAKGKTTGRELARRKRVSFGLISHIWNGRAWSHIKI